MFFFFQAEDGIRDLYVTGVQTCALPICRPRPPLHAVDGPEITRGVGPLVPDRDAVVLEPLDVGVASEEPEELVRSEERRVGKECRYRWTPDEEKEMEQRSDDDGQVAGDR